MVAGEPVLTFYTVIPGLTRGSKDGRLKPGHDELQ